MPLDLKRFFLEEGPHLNFFQASWLLERLYPRKGRMGTGDDLKTEAVRYETLNTLGFPPGDVAAILPPLSLQGQAEVNQAGKDAAPLDLAALPPMERLPDAGKGPLRMVVTFMGLYGVSSPLPAYFVDPITLRKVEYFELKKFLDVFSHRIYSLFYRSWKKYRHFALFRPDLPDDYTLRLLALTGQWPRRAARAPRPAPGTRQAPASPAPAAGFPGASAGAAARGAEPAAGWPAPQPEFDLRRIPFARFLGSRVRSAKGLQQLLRGYFGFPKVRVLQFASSWVEIPVRTRLGSGETVLGSSARLGESMEDRVSRFTVEIGPLPRGWFNRFLPSSRGLVARFRVGGSTPEPDEGTGPDGISSALLGRIKEMIEAYLRDPLDYQVKVLLEPAPGHPPALGSAHSRLGMGVWLGEKPAGEIACRW